MEPTPEQEQIILARTRLHEQDVKDLLGIPANVEAVALIPVGHPIGTYGPTKRRPVDEVIHHERWDSSKA